MNPIDFKPYLENFLTSHHFPKEEKEQILRQFQRDITSYPMGVVRIIDRTLGWRSAIMTFDYYYFNQMRWANFVVKNITGDTQKKEAISYFHYLTTQYASKPAWSDYGTFEKAIKEKRNEHDLLLTKEEFIKRRNYFQNLANNYKKYSE